MPGWAKFILPLAAVTAMCTGGCDKNPLSEGGPASQQVVRHSDPRVVELGRKVFQANCAHCHGDHAQGAFNWRQPGPDGRYPPPPLNGTGHDWHHPTAVLHEVIKQGSPAGQGNMPAWGGKLSDEEIAAVIAWFQSLWPDEVYAAWLEIERRAQAQ